MASKPRTGAGTNKPGAKKKLRHRGEGTTKSTKVIDVELDSPIDDPKTDGPQHSFLSRLYTGTGAFEVVGRRKLWYGISGAIIGIAILAILIRGFTFGIDFKGGTTVSMPSAGTVQVTQVDGRVQEDDRQRCPRR